MTPEPQRKSNTLKWILIIGGASLFLCCGGPIGLIAYLGSGPQAGVQLGNMLDSHALGNIEKNRLLKEGERVVAYYDATFRGKGTDVALVTNRRLVYFKEGRTTEMELASISDVSHRNEGINEGIIGDVIEVTGSDGDRMRIEVAPLNGGESFVAALNDAREAARPSEPEQKKAAEAVP